MANILLSSGLEAAQMAYTQRCRAEDMTHRKIENQRRLIDNARRKVDKKVSQLKAISHLAALIAGFSMVVLVEAQVQSDVPHVLVAAFGLSAACVIGLMLVAMLNCTLMLVIILKHDCSQPTGSTMTPTQVFLDFWQTRCEEDWQMAFKQFRMGVPAFLTNLTMLAWVKFWNHVLAAALVSVVAAIVTASWLLHTRVKWGRTKASSQPAATTQRRAHGGGAAARAGNGAAGGGGRGALRLQAGSPTPTSMAEHGHHLHASEGSIPVSADGVSVGSLGSRDTDDGHHHAV